jgi:hypothetical protein
MRGKITFLLLGIAIGFFIHRFSDTQRPSSATASDSQQNGTENITLHESPSAPDLQETKPLKEFKIVRGNGHVEVSRNQPNNQPEKTYGVRIEEAVVRELEEEKESLRQHAYAEIRDDGWQIHILEEDRALLHSGLSDGDIITHDSIHSQLQMADRTALVNRFVALLKYIER